MKVIIFCTRPFKKLEKMAAKQELTLKAQSGLVEKYRAVKDAQELELLRRSQALNEKVFQAVYQTIEPGMTEREIALALGTDHAGDGGRPAQVLRPSSPLAPTRLNRMPFPPIASWSRESWC